MKRALFLLIFCFLMFAHADIYAQSRWKIEMRGGRNFYIANDILKHWEGGWDFGAGAACRATPSLEVTAMAAYHHFSFDSGSVHPVLPLVIGLNYKIEGEDSYILETSVGGRLRNPEDKKGPFLILRGGIYYIREGRIRIITWYDDYSDNSIESEDESSIQVKPFVSAGLGFKIPVTNRMKIILESGLTTTFKAEQVAVPLLATVQWDL